MLGVIIFLIILAIALMLGVVITVKKHAYKMLISICGNVGYRYYVDHSWHNAVAEINARYGKGFCH